MRLITRAMTMSESNTQPVTRGWVRVTALNRPMTTNAPACSQMPRRRWGQRLPKPQRLPWGPSSAPRWSHSPGIGSGHRLHQARPPSGIKASLSAVHHAIQTKMMAKLAPPTGVPNSPTRIVKTKPAKAPACARNCGQRLRTKARITG